MNVKNPETSCVSCSKRTARRGYTYCSNNCQQEYQYQKYIEGWKAGRIVGLQRQGVVSFHIKKYLRAKYGNKCCVCGWCEINIKTHTTPLVADHIDGIWQNNIETNLRLVCPNCDSIGSTYGALNIGNGRPNRPVSKRTMEARLLQ